MELEGLFRDFMRLRERYKYFARSPDGPSE